MLNITTIQGKWTSEVTVRGCGVIKFYEPLVDSIKSNVYYVNELFEHLAEAADRHDDKADVSCGFDETKDGCDAAYCVFEIRGKYIGTKAYKHFLEEELTSLDKKVLLKSEEHVEIL